MLFVMFVCLQSKGIHAIVDLQCRGYLAAFLSNAWKDTINMLTSCSFFSPVSICFGQLMNI